MINQKITGPEIIAFLFNNNYELEYMFFKTFPLIQTTKLFKMETILNKIDLNESWCTKEWVFFFVILI